MRFTKIVTKELSGDDIIQLTPELADVEVFFRSYFRKTPAINVETHKLVTVTAFHFEAHVRSNFLTEDSHTIKELGRWVDSRRVVQRTAQRVGKVIREMIGPNIPKDRKKFLSSLSKGI